jgi:drug/metabolite transporter (DMT)-like permease
LFSRKIPVQVKNVTARQATLIGLIAIVLWSSIVGLIRTVSEGLGPTGGAAMIYTVASVFLLFTVGFPKVRSFPRRYLLFGSILFVAYELCLSLAIGFASNSQHAIEAGILNYLWPAFTVVFAIVFNGQKSNLLIVPALLLSLFGAFWVLNGGQRLDFAGILANIKSNPLSYGLAFSGALIWAAYCTMTSRLAAGKNGITVFFMLTALTLWVLHLVGGGGLVEFDYRSAAYLLLAAAAMGFGYAAWNVGILYGNVTLLAGASYFIPIFSSVISAMLLRTPLSMSFWQGRRWSAWDRSWGGWQHVSSAQHEMLLKEGCLLKNTQPPTILHSADYIAFGM